jgi:restriction system protein
VRLPKLRFADYHEGSLTEIVSQGTVFGDKDLKKLKKNVDMHNCIYCTGNLNMVVSKEEGNSSFYSHGDVLECESCGWWSASKTFVDFESDYPQAFTKIFHSVIKNYSIADKNPLILNVHRELKKDPSKIASMNKTAFEKYMAEVLENHFSCQVKHVGKSDDGGVDLWILENEEKTLVQVKNRELHKTEGVGTVRSLLGSMLDMDIYRGMIISTAKTFTEPSKKMVNRNLAKGSVERLDIKNCNDIFEMIGAINGKDEKLWAPIFQKLWAKPKK